MKPIRRWRSKLRDWWQGLSGQQRVVVLFAGVALVVGLIVAALPERLECEPARGVQDVLGRGLRNDGHSLWGAQAVELDPPSVLTEGTVSLVYKYVVAAEVDGPGVEGKGDVGVWAIRWLDRDRDPGLIQAIDHAAQRFSVWGEAGRRGSRADEQRKEIAARRETDHVGQCVE